MKNENVDKINIEHIISKYISEKDKYDDVRMNNK